MSDQPTPNDAMHDALALVCDAAEEFAGVLEGADHQIGEDPDADYDAAARILLAVRRLSEDVAIIDTREHV